MQEPYERLQSVRKKAGFDDATAAARYFGWNENTYRSHENGERGLRPNVAERYAKAFRSTAAYLMTGQGPEQAKNIAPLVGRVRAGGQVFPEFEQADGGLEEIETVLPLPQGAVAFEVEGNSMWPKYDPQDVIVCLAQGSPIERVLGHYAAVRTKDGHRFIKRVINGTRPGLYDLEGLNAEPIRGAHLVWVSEIVASLPAQQWKKLEGSGPKMATRRAKR